MISCKDSKSVNESDWLYGVWVKERTEEDVTVLRKSTELNENEYGFIIYSDGDFVERKNAGWCGTPPITYANYEGKWKRLSENILEVEVGYWGGVITYQLEIVSLDADELRIRYRYES